MFTLVICVTYRLGDKVERAEGVELVANLAPEVLNLVVLLAELLVAGVLGSTTGNLGLEVVLVDLRERLGRLGVLELKEARGEEGSGLVCAHTLGRVKVVVEDTLLDELLKRGDALLGDDRDDLGDVLKVEVLLEKRVFRTGTGRSLTHKCPVLGTNGLALQLGNLVCQLALSPLVRRKNLFAVLVVLTVVKQVALDALHGITGLVNVVLVGPLNWLVLVVLVGKRRLALLLALAARLALALASLSCRLLLGRWCEEVGVGDVWLSVIFA
jgi:hypothetical protein